MKCLNRFEAFKRGVKECGYDLGVKRVVIYDALQSMTFGYRETA